MSAAKAMKVIAKKDVWHLVREGRVLHPSIDEESNALLNPFILEHARSGWDMAGNHIATSHITVRRPDWILGDPRAFIVTRTDPEDSKSADRDPLPVAMAKIAWEHQNNIKLIEQLPLESKFISFELLQKKKKREVRKPVFNEEVREYPLLDEAGNIVYVLRYHPERGKWSYRLEDDEEATGERYVDADGSRWKMVDDHPQTGGWNVKRADISWLRQNFLRAGFHPSDLFFHTSRAHLTNKQLKKGITVDYQKETEVVHAFMEEDENSVKIGGRLDGETGTRVPSLKLGLTMRANTRYPNPERGITGGVLLPDGSIFTESKAHRNVGYDADAAGAMHAYNRKMAPHIVRHVELQADPRELRRMLGEGNNPEVDAVYGMVRNGYPKVYPPADPVIPLMPDDQEGNLRRVPVIRMDRDLETFEYNKKTLLEMTAEEIARMIEETKRSSEAVIRLVPILHWPTLVPIDDALHGISKNGDDLEQARLYDTINANLNFRKENSDLIAKIEDAVLIIERRLRHRPEKANPLPEEQGLRNGFGNLDYWQKQAARDASQRKKGNGGELPTIAETLFNRATDIYNHMNKTDALLHHVAVMGHIIDGRDDDEALGNFRDLLKRTRSKLRSKIYAQQVVRFTAADGTVLPVPTPPISKKIGKFEFTAHVKSPLLEKMHAEGRLRNPGPDDRALIREITTAAHDKIFSLAADAVAHPRRKYDAPKNYRLPSVDDGNKTHRLEIEVTEHKPSVYRNLLADDPWVKSFIKHFKPGQAMNKVYAEEARAFRWNLARRLLDDDLAAREDPKSTYSRNLFDYDSLTQGRLLFADPSRDFLVVDKAGREIDFDYLQLQNAQYPQRVIDRFEAGDWKIQFHRQSAVPSIAVLLDRFDYMGKLLDLPHHWRREHELQVGHRVWGPPGVDPEEHRWPTIPFVRRIIEKIELNVKSGDREALARVFGDYARMGRGEADIFMKHDESHRILNAMKLEVEDLAKKYPFREAFNGAANYDANGMAYEWIQHELDSKNIVIVDVPDTHLRRPMTDMTVGSPYSLVVNQPSPSLLRRIESGAEIVFRGAQTGQMMYGGPAELRFAPDEAAGYKDYYAHVSKAYRDAGMPPPAAHARAVFVLEKPKPLAHTRTNIDPGLQAVKVPADYFTALVAPVLSHMPSDTPLTGLVLPADYCTQSLEVGKRMRFREMDAPMGAKLEGLAGRDTGNIYESILRGVRRMSVGDIKEKVDEQTAAACGFASRHEMWEQLTTAFRRQESPDPQAEQVYVMDFDKVKKTSWAFWDPATTPKAALVYHGKPVPPSAYRPVRRAA